MVKGAGNKVSWSTKSSLKQSTLFRFCKRKQGELFPHSPSSYGCSYPFTSEEACWLQVRATRHPCPSTSTQVDDFGPLMKGLAIGGLGIVHVFLAQFAIGGGW